MPEGLFALQGFPPKQACGSPTKRCSQEGPSPSEVITVDFGLEMSRPFQVVSHGRISYSAQYRPKR